MLPPEVWGDGDPEGVRRRAAERMKDTARAAAQLGVEVVTGFTGSSVWHMLYSFPPNDFAEVERGYEDFAERWGPIIDVFDAEGVKFALEVHPTEIAYDFVTTRKTLDAIDNREGFGINFDPSHFEHQFLDSATFVTEFADRIYHVHVKDSINRLDGRRSILGGHLNFGEEARGWDFVSPGHGDVDFESLFRALNRIGYQGPLSIEWEDSGMDRDWGAPDALAFVRATDFSPSTVAFDAAFAQGARMSKVGFVTMGESAGGDDIPTVGVGMLGYGFMGKAHSNAYKTLAYMTWPPPLMPQLVSIAGRNEEAVAAAAGRYGFADHVTDWKKLSRTRGSASSTTPGPNNFHAEPTIAAAEAGKHVICEKPLGRTADEAYETWQRVAATGVKAMCAFNYRFVPAVRLAREIIASGDLGEIFHFRGRYLQEWIIDADFPMVWRLDKDVAGSGALGDLGAHVIDLARYLVGEIDAVSARTRTFVKDREGGAVTVDDAVESVVDFAGGAVGTIEATRFASGRKNALQFEINGSKGSLSFDIERLNELEVHYRDSSPGKLSQGFRTVLVSEADHPFWEHWWPQGHMIGWEHTFVHEIHHFLSAIRDDTEIAPHGATFEDGYRAAEICDAMLRSDESGCARAGRLPVLRPIANGKRAPRGARFPA